MKASPVQLKSGLDRRNQRSGNPSSPIAVACRPVSPNDEGQFKSNTRHERLSGPSSDSLVSAAQTYHVDSRLADLFKESSTVYRPQTVAHLCRPRRPKASKGQPMQLPAGVVDTPIIELLKAILVCLLVLDFQISSSFAAPPKPQKALQSPGTVSAHLLVNQDFSSQATPATPTMHRNHQDQHMQLLSHLRGLHNVASQYRAPADRRLHVSSGPLEFSEQHQQHSSWPQQRDQHLTPSSLHQHRPFKTEPVDDHNHPLEAERHAPLWTIGGNDLIQSASSNNGDGGVSHLEPNHHQYHHQQQQQRLQQPDDLFISRYKSAPAVPGDSAESRKQPMQRQQLAPTTPSLNKQLLAPPFYELGLAPTNTIQLESGPSVDAGLLLPTAPLASHQHEQQQHVPSAATTSRVPGTLQNQSGRANAGRQVSDLLANQMAREFRAQLEQQQQHHHHNQAIASDVRQAMLAESVSDDKQETGGGGSSNNNNRQSDVSVASQQPPAAETEIEPRQRRRIFNRILKKAEWNHLFVELSKVFLRYFLDLALKDIIGKQSGSTSASGTGDSSTSSRKKLDAQSELADLLRDFVKTAIANI